jgi:hypothetical protein
MPSFPITVGTTLLFTGKCTFNSAQLISDGTNACSVKVYDARTAVAAKQIVQLNVPATTTVPATVVFNNAIKCEDGMTVVVAGTGATALINFNGA